MSKFKVGEKVLVEGEVASINENLMDIVVYAGGEFHHINSMYKGDVFPIKQDKEVKVMMPVVEPEKDEPEYSLGQVVLYQGEVCYVTHIEEKRITSIHPGEDHMHIHYTVSSIGTGREQKVVYPEFMSAYEENACYEGDVHTLARITKKYVDFLFDKNSGKVEVK